MIHTIYKPIQYVKWDGTNFVEILEFTKTYCYAIGDTLYFNNIPLEKGTIIYKDDYCFKISTLDDFNDYIRNYITNIFITPFVITKLQDRCDKINVSNHPGIKLNDNFIHNEIMYYDTSTKEVEDSPKSVFIQSVSQTDFIPNLTKFNIDYVW